MGSVGSRSNNLPSIVYPGGRESEFEAKMKVQLSKDTGYTGDRLDDAYKLLKKWIGGVASDRKQLSKSKLDDLIDTIPKYKGTAYRGLDLSPQALSKYRVGNEVSLRGVGSFTSDEKIALKFADPEYRNSPRNRDVVLVVPNSTQGARIGYMSRHNEAEVLYKSTSKFMVTRRESKSGTLYIYLEEKKRKR